MLKECSIPKEDIFKEIKKHNFKNEYKYLNKLIKSNSIEDILIEEKEAVFGKGILKGNATTYGSNPNSLNPNFKVKLTLDFESPPIYGTESGERIAVSNYAYLNSLYDKKLDLNYPYYKGNEEEGFKEVTKKFYGLYYEKINLSLESIKINNGKFEFTESTITTNIFIVKILKNKYLKEYEDIAYIIYKNKDLTEQELVFKDFMEESI